MRGEPARALKALLGDAAILANGTFVFFSDPDGNGWAVQAIPPRD
jgi:hypothetical protein